MRGKVSNLITVSRFFKSQSNISQVNKEKIVALPFLVRLQLFSSMDGDDTGRGQFRKSGFNEISNDSSDDDDKFSGKNGGNFVTHQKFSGPNPIPGRPLRGERESQQFRRQNYANPDRRRRGGRNDGFSKEGSRANMKSNDEFFKFDGNGEVRGNVGLGGNEEVKKGSRPSISELLNRPFKGDEGIGQEGGGFLEKFKLGGGGGGDKKGDQLGEAKSTPLPQEEKMKPPEDADVIFKKMKQTGLIPNAVAMLDGLCKDGLVQEAMKLFGLMREKGTMPEVVVYTAVVEGFCQAQKLDDAVRIFKKMQNNGIVPNAFSYTVLVKGLCKGKRLEDAVDVCVEMLEAGHSPNVITFTNLVHEFCKEKGVEEAKKIIGTLKQKGFLLDEKAVRDYLDKTGPTSPMVWEAIFGPKKATQRTF